MSEPSLGDFAFGLETTTPLSPTQNYFQLLGWVHLPGSPSQTPVRVVVGERRFQPSERIERSDIAEEFPMDAGARQSGFKFLGYLPFGFYAGKLEAADQAGKWHVLRHLALPVSSHPVLGGIEKPPVESTVTKPARVEGWCFHPEFETSEIVVQFGNVEVPCEIGLERPDAAENLPDHPRARFSGFITTENLPRGAGQAKVRLLTKCGRVYFIDSELQVDIRDGWIPKPPPPSPVRDLSTAAAPSLNSTTSSTVRPESKITPGSRNILFALYGDFGSNSALHVAALANHLIALGYDCVVAVPDYKETLGGLPRADFMATEFSEVDNLHAYFKDQQGPAVVHAWTPREIVRKFCKRVGQVFDTSFVVHLEDNERDILSSRLDRPFDELAGLSMKELDKIVPDVLTHPRRGATFLEQSVGASVIVDALREHATPGHPVHLIWPAADENHFRPLPRNDDLRHSLGIPDRTIVLFYHGNVHASNNAEVTELYRAVARLNENGHPTLLIRTGHDYPGFLPDGGDWIEPYLISLGYVGRARNLPPLMAMADYFVQPGWPGEFNDYRFPSKLPEFFSLGRPVILPETNLGKIMRHGENAWVLPTANATSITAAIMHLQTEPETRDRLAAGALELVKERFSWDQSAQSLAGFYCSITSLANLVDD